MECPKYCIDCKIVNKLSYITILANDLKADVLCFVEHWRTYQELSIVNIPSYYMANYFCRSGSGLHGGSAIYVKDNLEVKELINVSDVALQNLFEVCSIFILTFMVLYST